MVDTTASIAPLRRRRGNREFDMSRFRRHRELTRLDISARRVLRLERSLSGGQVALPGRPAEDATAYLCAFAAGQGIRIAVVLHLQCSRQLAFYLNAEGEMAKREATAVYNQALAFAESMGFMMGDLDIHLKSPAERAALWESLPLAAGLGEPSPAPGPAATANPQRPATERTVPAPAPPAGNLAARRQAIRARLGRFLGSF
jgi:hypothetical protein